MSKIEKIAKDVEQDLNQLLDFYFSNYEQTKDKFDKINLEWKKRVNYINRKQKLVRVNIDSFEKEVARIISENPQFQEVIDLTKI